MKIISTRKKNIAGISFSDTALRVVFLKRITKKENAISSLVLPLQKNIVVGGVVKDVEKITSILEEIKNKHGIYKMRFVLPDAHTNPQDIKNIFLLIAKKIKITCDLVDKESSVIARAIVKPADIDTRIVVFCDTSRTVIFIVCKNVIQEVYTSMYGIGGVHSKETQAVIADIKKIYVYWHQKNKSRIKEVLLCGEKSTQKDLADFMTASLIIPVHMANPWCNYLSFEEIIPSINKDEVHGIVASLGICLSI